MLLQLVGDLALQEEVEEAAGYERKREEKVRDLSDHVHFCTYTNSSGLRDPSSPFSSLKAVFIVCFFEAVWVARSRKKNVVHGMTTWLTFNITEFGTPMVFMALVLGTFVFVGCVACSLLPNESKRSDQHFE